MNISVNGRNLWYLDPNAPPQKDPGTYKVFLTFIKPLSFVC